MRWYWKPRQPGEFDHEAVWGSLALAVLAAARFFPFHRINFPVCWFHKLSGLPCPSCGGTRAFIALAHGRWVEGISIHPGAAVLFLAACCYVPYAAWTVACRRPRLRVALTSGRERVGLVVAAAALILLNWIYLILAGR
jgi:hypothetical protein